MATPRSQRIGIWIIALVLTIGTLGSFLVMVLSMQNQSTFRAKYLAADAKYQSAVTAQTKELSDKYFNSFNQYLSRVSTYDSAGITELSNTDLIIGDGTEISTNKIEYSMYYIGWNPSGVIFDSSFNDGKTELKLPLSHNSDGTWTFPGGTVGSVIEGWTKGLIGMKIGGIRELLIPSNLAYGEAGMGDTIPANTPIKFIVMAIPKITQVPIPPELIEYYKAMNS